MSDVILVHPTPHVLEGPGGPIHVTEISLGGTPRGLVVLLTDDEVPDVDVVQSMNHFVMEGYESIAARVDLDGVDVVLGRAAERGWHDDQVGVVGLGAGATLALDLALRRELGAAVAFSPTPDLDRLAAEPALRTPWLGMFGEDAAGLTRGEVHRLRGTLRGGSDVFSHVVSYPGVGADFHRRTETGVAFAASYDSWQRATEWLNARVAARLTPLAVAWRNRQHAAPSV
ncbi:dienelactone hydrolase [Nocardioides sp. BE266]|uniref:dienelactone hydrolase family protein n=1 Tax=Nocardioides sp. BE266 TaxID=2817725 RepID=UPI00285C4ED7|nr:dienelactone hydrolase family protein [Nocardioides sp. BE266]MDR7254207.1 dienelactone hydrolase [Nocardioides sp. BE266]